MKVCLLRKKNEVVDHNYRRKSTTVDKLSQQIKIPVSVVPRSSELKHSRGINDNYVFNKKGMARVDGRFASGSPKESRHGDRDKPSMFWQESC
jgi:hypothetical protein